MFRIFSPLMVLLTLVGGNNGQRYPDCDYATNVEPGKEYYIYNKEYPEKYGNGSSCRWIATSDRPMQLTCDIKIPPSTRCRDDALTIQDATDRTGRRYCGNGNLNITSKSNRLTVYFTSTSNSKGGTFVCTLKAPLPNNNELNCNCGWKNPTRIVGGEETGVNEYPMMAGLVDATKSMVLCGSTIINEKQVLTAAHCIAGRDPRDFGVLVGDHDLRTGNETNATVLYRAESFQIHPLYNEQTVDYDIAIVTISGRIQYSQQVGPACLPFQHSPDTFAGDYVEILGWGSMEAAGATSNTLQKARVSVITNLECRREYPAVSTRQLCTLEPGKDSCQFDSGGPVLWQNPSTRRIVEIGITSLGGACGADEAVQNTRVGAFVDWIESMKPRDVTYCKIE